MAQRGKSLRRRLRSSGGKLLRRLGMLPGGMPDGLGQDDVLLGTRLEHSIVVYFPDPPDSLYQIEQWYGPLRALHAELPTVVVCMDSRAAARIRADSGLDVITVARDATLDDLLAHSAVKLFLYVNHNPQNFSAIRLRSVIHVSMLHGDSDKTVSISNQVKAYDFSFVAGQAAIDRFADYTTLFDAQARCIPIGRPQRDTDGVVAPREASIAGGLATVLYAPTWEGGQASVAYGSVDTHGEAIVRSLLDDGRFRVHYRPHPLSGVRMSAYGDADAAIRALLAQASEREPLAGHGLADEGTIAEAFDDADVLICDVSAVANDWLPTTRPLVITEPADEAARPAATRLLRVAPRLTASDSLRTAQIVGNQLNTDPSRAQRLELVDYYLGDTARGTALERFITVCRDLMVLRDAEWGRIEAAEL